MAVVSTRAPTDFDPSSMGGHYADTAPSLSDISDSEDALTRGLRLFGNIRGGSRFSGSEDTANIMRERVRRTLADREDLSIYDETLNSRLDAWTTGDPEGALAAYGAYKELMDKRERFRKALHGAFNGAPRASGDGLMSDATEIGSLAPPGFTEYPDEEFFSNDDEFSRAIVPRTVKSQEEIEDEIVTGHNKEGIPTRLLEDLRRTGKTAHPMAMTTLRPVSDEHTLVPYSGMDDSRVRDVINGPNQIQIPTRTATSLDNPTIRNIVNGLNSSRVPPQYTRAPHSGATTQGLGNAMSRIGQMWESVVSRMDQDRSEAIRWKQANPLGGTDEFGAAEEVDEDGQVKTQVEYRNGRLKNGGSFQSFSYSSASGAKGLPDAAGLRQMMSMIQAAH